MYVTVRINEESGDIIIEHDPTMRVDNVIALLQLGTFKVSGSYFGAVLDSQTQNASENGSPADKSLTTDGR